MTSCSRDANPRSERVGVEDVGGGCASSIRGGWWHSFLAFPAVGFGRAWSMRVAGVEDGAPVGDDAAPLDAVAMDDVGTLKTKIKKIKNIKIKK